MGYGMLLAKKLNRLEAGKVGLFLLVGFCIGVLTCILALSVLTVEQQLSLVNGVWANAVGKSNNNSEIPDAGPGHETQGINPSKNGVVRVNQNSSSAKDEAPSGRQVKDTTTQREGKKETESKHGKDADEKAQQETSSTIKNTIQKEEKIKPKQPDGTIKAMKAQNKPICDLSNWRTDVCEMDGDARVHGKSSSVVLVTDHQPHNSDRKESWQIKPYARKFDKAAMQHIQEVSVRLSNGLLRDAPQCTINHTVPAIVFAIGGYTGNYYHDYTDALIPLFITSRQFDGEVQFLIATKKFWWIGKYEQILKKLSRYKIIYFDTDDEVRCFRHVIVGLHSHKPMSIDPARAPNGYSMVDFTKFMRTAYSLERDSPIRLGEHQGQKPRLLLIPRNKTRKFTNFDEIVRMAEEADFEVVVEEARTATNLAKFVRVINSCDVMMGVHGAGLTNFVYLPTNAVIIQIIPYGNLVNISRSCFKYSSEDAKLHYLEYIISVEESSLIKQYPRDHPVFTDPKSIHKLGWKEMGDVYLENQDVKLDVNRFKPLLLKARELLRQ